MGGVSLQHSPEGWGIHSLLRGLVGCTWMGTPGWQLLGDQTEHTMEARVGSGRWAWDPEAEDGGRYRTNDHSGSRSRGNKFLLEDFGELR